MRTILYTFLAIILGQNLLWAQIEQTTHGSGYGLQTYYNIESGESTSVDMLTWDIAFTTSGQGAGVLINEGIPATMGAPVGEIQLYYKEGLTFESQDTSGKIRFYNDESSWEKGAFNTILVPGNPFDFGWGTYNPVNHSVTGEKVFLIKLRDNSWKKINISSLISGTFTFEIADFDGSNRSVKTFAKSEFSGNTLAYYSFDSDMFLDLEPANWDLLFTRYSTPLDNGGELLNYQVSGTLTNSGVKVVKVTGVDPENVDYEDYISGLTPANNTIGHDWKYFDLGTFQWSIPADLVYFIKTGENELWKLVFLDFEGSSTGTVTLEKTFLTTLTSVAKQYESIQSLEVFPNPTSSTFSIAFELKNTTNQGQVTIANMNGVVVHKSNEVFNTGFNMMNLDLNLPAGVYNVILTTDKDVLTKKLMIIK